jgi:hypothetical protein
MHQNNSTDETGSAVEQCSNAINPNDKNNGKTGRGPNLVKQEKRPKTYQEAVSQRAGDLTECAKAHPESVPMGGMKLIITISAAGSAKSVAVEPDSINAAPLGACLRNVLMKTKYPINTTSNADQKLTVPLNPKT